MDILLSIAVRCRRRVGIFGIAVTASQAATAGGRALASWLCGVRAGRPPFCPLILTVCVDVADFSGVREGMTTGLDMVAAGACIGAGCGSVFETDKFLSIDCVCVSTFTGLGLRGEGLDRVRVPILSDLEPRGDGGDC